ncbi:MAG: Mur ligase family protein [Gammaproteobacteria bacterium]|nr:Mur ligase family protein [Gammaproteobacteria bacterium]
MRADQAANPTGKTVEALVTEIARQRAQLTQSRSFSSIRKVAQELGLHRVASKQVVVGGTNGKGSTVRYLQQLLSHQGIRVGTTTSPHVHNYLERIMLDGVQVEPTQCLNAIHAIADATRDIALTYFDLTTLAALHVFNQWKVDVAVVEVGLGGRLDCANVVDCDVAVITNVDLDHCDILGDTIEAISREKVPIARPSKPLVFADNRVNQVVREYANEHGNPLFRFGTEFGVSDARSVFFTEGSGLRTMPLPSSIDYPLESFSSALQAAALMNRAPYDKQLETMRFSILAGRLERRFVSDRHWIFDVAHNPAAIVYLRRAIAKRNFAKCVVVFACFSDKDVEGMLESIVNPGVRDAAKVIGIVLTDSHGERALSATAVQRIVKERHCPVHVESKLDSALRIASKLATDQDVPIVILGSFDVVARARRALNISTTENVVP